MSSTHAFNPRAGMGQYDVTKARIVSMTRQTRAACVLRRVMKKPKPA